VEIRPLKRCQRDLVTLGTSSFISWVSFINSCSASGFLSSTSFHKKEAILFQTNLNNGER